MKKGRAYVVKGRSEETPAAAFGAMDDLPPLPTWLQPSTRAEGLMPYDYGMAGPVGAYEVKRITRSVAKSLHLLEEQLGVSDDDPLAIVNAELAKLLPPQERQNLVAERFEGNVLLLTLTRRADRFRYNRFLLPKLRAALRPHFGAITCRFLDR